MPEQIPFREFPKLARLSREIVITEKIDGTNASILIEQDGTFLVGSRNRWITPEDDNFGFARWAHQNRTELEKLGPGHHFGEWWGAGIQRRYGQTTKRFSLFNAHRWAWLNTTTPEQNSLVSVVGVVPVLYTGPFDTAAIDDTINKLAAFGSKAAPGFMQPEGIVVYHTASGVSFKKTIVDDHKPKSQA